MADHRVHGTIHQRPAERFASEEARKLVAVDTRRPPPCERVASWPKLLIVDEVGYLPLDQLGANLFFQLGPRRYERAWILITSHQSLTG